MAKTADNKLEDYVRQIAKELLNGIRDQTVRAQLEETLEAIWRRDKYRAYLAVRGYLRFPPPGRSGTIEDNWVWSEARGKAFKKGKYFLETVEPLLLRVKNEFVSLNASFGRKAAYGLEVQDRAPFPE